jgi:hypothetical protein
LTSVVSPTQPFSFLAFDAFVMKESRNPQPSRPNRQMKTILRSRLARQRTQVSLICHAVLLLLAVSARGAFIDSFAVGPQEHVLGPGDAFWGETVSGLDPAQVLGGGRRLTLLADSDGPYRPVDEGTFSAILAGSNPGSLSVQASVVTAPDSSKYDPAVMLDYDCPAEDWSGFTGIVVQFASPPSEPLQLETSLNSGGGDYYSEAVVPAGSLSFAVSFSGLGGSSPIVLTAVTSLRLKFILPAMASVGLRDVQLGGGAAPAPRLNISLGGGVAVTWPTNATGFTLESAPNLAAQFSAVTNAPVVSGTNYEVTVPADAPAQFFRLRRPN